MSFSTTVDELCTFCTDDVSEDRAQHTTLALTMRMIQCNQQFKGCQKKSLK